jgi:hypothetical protein
LASFPLAMTRAEVATAFETDSARGSHWNGSGTQHEFARSPYIYHLPSDVQDRASATALGLNALSLGTSTLNVQPSLFARAEHVIE